MAGSYGYCPAAPRIHPDTNKKTYCSYWIRTGECDYTQQGCRYKHEMPDLETLNRIGFRDFPLWWKQRLFNRPTGPQNDALKKIMAQPSDSEDSSSDCDGDPEKSSPIAANASATVGTPKSQRAVHVNRVDAPPPTAESFNLIDLELVNYESSEQTPAASSFVIRNEQFVLYNEPRPITSGPSNETLHPPFSSTSLPPSHVESLTMPVPTVPHPTPTISPEPKPPATRKGKARSKDVPTTEFSSLIDQQRGHTKTVGSTDDKNINPLDLHQQIEKLQHHQREIEILAAGVCGTHSQLANAKNMGPKTSESAKPSESENIILSDTTNTEKRKTRKSRRSKRSIKARTLSPTPVPKLT
jgi:hypothetical protein